MDKLNNCQNAISKKTFEAIVSPWMKNIKAGDIVSVVSYPGSDRRRRLNALVANRDLQEKYLGKGSHYQWITIDLRINKFNRAEDLEKYVMSQKKPDSRIILAIIGAESIIREKNISLLLWLIEMNRFNIFRTLLFFEINIFSKNSLDFLNQISVFQPRIHALSLYEEADSRQFVDHMEKEHRWDLNLKKPLKKDVIKKCGGVLLFLKEALWFVRDNPHASEFDIFNHREMRFSLSFFWNSFDDEEKELLTKIALNEDIKDVKYKPSLEYLLMTKIIALSSDSYKITVPLLEGYIKEQNRIVFYPEARGEDILVNGNCVTSDFSKSEKQILVYLIGNPDKLVSRDKIAFLMWGNSFNTKYSDWAIDSTLSRLRKKLNRFGLPKNTIQTMKGQGVIYIRH